MQKAILTLSKDNSLVDQIRSNLEEGGRYYVQGVTSAHGALAMVRHRSFDLAILDLDQSDLSGPQLIHNLKKIQPEIKVLVYNPSEALEQSDYKDLPLDGTLGKPFFAPELSELLKTFFSPNNPAHESVLASLPMDQVEGAWKETSGDDLVEISHLLESTGALSAMTFIQGKPATITSGMNPVIAQKITTFIEKIWPDYKGLEICRYMRGEDDLGPCLIYALPISPDMLMVFTYPPSSDLRSIRHETSKLRDAFLIGRYSKQEAARPGGLYPLLTQSEDNEFKRVVNTDEAEPAPDLTSSDSQWVLEFDSSNSGILSAEVESLLKSSSETANPEPAPDALGDTQPIRITSRMEKTLADKSLSDSEFFLSEEQAQKIPLADISTAIEEDIRSHHLDEQVPEPQELSVVLPWEETGNNAKPQSAEPNPAASEESSLQEMVQAPLLEPKGRAYNIYHCIIVPAGPRQFLTRELGEESAALIRRHHQMNGWELSRLAVRPQYAMWTVHLPASVDPVKVVEEIKEETSTLLKSTFSDQILVSPDESFWASGYWILSGEQPPAGSLIKQFLNFHRQKSTEKQAQND